MVLENPEDVLYSKYEPKDLIDATNPAKAMRVMKDLGFYQKTIK